MGLAEDHLNMLRGSLLELSLQVPTTMLVLAETIEFALVMFQRKIGESRKLSRIAFTRPAISGTPGWSLTNSVVAISIEPSIRSRGRIVVWKLAIDRIVHVRLEIVSIDRRLECSQGGWSCRARVASPGSQLRPERRGIGLKSSLLALRVRQLALVTFWRVPVLAAIHSTSRDPSQASIVLVKLVTVGFGRGDS
jgi:hypothetical protein